MTMADNSDVISKLRASVNREASDVEVFKSILTHSFFIMASPIITFFLCSFMLHRINIESADVIAAIAAVVVLHLFLFIFIYKAYLGGKETYFEGILQKTEDDNRICLKKCINKDMNVQLKGNCPFFVSDLTDIVVMDSVEKIRSETSAIVSKNMHNNFRSSDYSKPEHLSKLKVVDIDLLLGGSNDSKISSQTHGDIPRPEMDLSCTYEDSNAEIETIRNTLWTNGPPSLSYVPSSFVYIESPSSRLFDKALDELLTQRMVGLSIEGQAIGRDGKGSLFSFSTLDKIYLFDIFEEEERFSESLKPILVSPSIVKIVHDCRMMSDYLDKVFNIRPNNIYDTLGAHISFLTWAIHSGHVINYAVSVGYCVRSYLGVSANSLYFPKYRREYMEKMDNAIWLQRPLLESCRTNAIKNVMFLLDLYVILQEAIALPAIKATNALLSVVRDSDLPDFYKQMSNVEEIPKTVMNKLPQWNKRELSPSYGIPQGIRLHQCIAQYNNSLTFSKHIMHMKAESLDN
ncbi:EXD1 [Lepeophtheirus salmonis]|uniref:EXD1 n=1 Tax=Lepeophtheirus salmonis TaxID=72036 RepID=A0A7R8H0Y5_LEPSM|nr:EXD1 [Lepeophtheirus salmonis]CAF2778834.1 EXD1 [Lepeophtheirus salmonis]